MMPPMRTCIVSRSHARPSANGAFLPSPGLIRQSENLRAQFLSATHLIDTNTLAYVWIACEDVAAHSLFEVSNACMRECVNRRIDVKTKATS